MHVCVFAWYAVPVCLNGRRWLLLAQQVCIATAVICTGPDTNRAVGSSICGSGHPMHFAAVLSFKPRKATEHLAV